MKIMQNDENSKVSPAMGDFLRVFIIIKTLSDFGKCFEYSEDFYFCEKAVSSCNHGVLIY